MGGCCDSRGCDRRFSPRFARRMAKKYRKQGLDPTARRMVDLLPPGDVQGASVLEIGGGVGEVHVELLRRGAASAVALELSPAYDDAAGQLLVEAGLTGRVQRRLADIAADPDAVEPADVVVMHRVVCCYPDHPRLLGAAADRARRHLVFSYPARNAVTRALFAAENLGHRLARRDFRVHAHRPEAMQAVVAGHGLVIQPVVRSGAWRIVVASREPVTR